MAGKNNMDLLTQAITQRPPRSPSPPPSFHSHSTYQSRREDARRSITPPTTTTNSVATTGEARGNARRANIASQLQLLDTEFAKKKDRYFHEQLRQLQEDLSRLHDGTHHDFNVGVADLLDIRNESLYIAREEGLAKLKLAELDYEREMAAANEEYDSTRATLKNDLLTHLQNKKRKLENDKTLSDISLSSTLEATAAAAPPSPSLMPVTAGSRKLRHRIPVPMVGTTYPSSSLTSKSALDEVLEGLGETIRSRHLKHNQQPQNEERVKDRIEREREKLVRSMLVGAAVQEADADLAEMRRRAPHGSGSGGGNHRSSLSGLSGGGGGSMTTTTIGAAGLLGSGHGTAAAATSAGSGGKKAASSGSGHTTSKRIKA